MTDSNESEVPKKVSKWDKWDKAENLRITIDGQVFEGEAAHAIIDALKRSEASGIARKMMERVKTMAPIVRGLPFTKGE